jgi:hypothetical protein
MRALRAVCHESGFCRQSDCRESLRSCLSADPTRTVTVPVHAGRDLKPGTPRLIIRQTGLTGGVHRTSVVSLPRFQKRANGYCSKKYRDGSIRIDGQAAGAWRGARATPRNGRRIASSHRRRLLELAELAVWQDDDAYGSLAFVRDQAYIPVVARRWR